MPENASLNDLHLLANSIRRSYNRLRHTTDQIHANTGITAPKRTLMMDLNRNGPQTVPALAAARFISRQIIQTQVNELKVEGYLKASPNPEHKRSVLIALTPTGKAMVKKMIEAENKFIRKLGWLPKAEEVSTCQSVLDEIYERLDQDAD